MKNTASFCLDLLGIISGIPMITWGFVAFIGEFGATAGGCFISAVSISIVAIFSKS